jgi:hypothetical protein
VYVIGVEPVHDPGAAVSVLPWTAVPVTRGRVVFRGAVLVEGVELPELEVDAAAMAVVTADVALPLPAEFVAVTVTRNRDPSCVDEGVYELRVAPAMSEQLLPPASQRCHW